MKNIGIISPGGNYFFKNDLAVLLNANLYTLDTDENNIECDNLFLIGYESLLRYSKFENKKFKSVSAIFSDTLFCVNYLWCNSYCSNNKINVFAMPDLDRYLKINYVPVYQYIIMPKISIQKSDENIVFISHSPQGHKKNMNVKGTNEINDFINKLSDNFNIQYDVISGFEWNDCIAIKSKSHIFIDQLVKNNPNIDQKRFGTIEYSGAIARSSIEAMHLNCCVVTSMDYPDTEKYFPKPPVIFTDYYNFYYDIKRLLNDVDIINEYANKQNEWVKKYCCAEFVKENFTRFLK